MDTKQMFVANVNIVFGKDEEPLLKHLEDIVLPALQKGIVKKVSEKTKFFFDDVQLKDMGNDEWIIQGVLIKDTQIEAASKYDNEGLKNENVYVEAAPYSIFMIFLKNHRMILVKNEGKSPDIRSFSSTLKYVLMKQIRSFNEEHKDDKTNRMPNAITSVTGIKTMQSVKNTLESVEKIRSLTFKFYPLNAEWDYDSVFGGIDEKIRKTIQAKKGQMRFPSPQSKDGVAEIIEASEGLVKTEMEVIYKRTSNDDLDESTRKGKIKDNEIAETLGIDVAAELNSSYQEIFNSTRDIKALKNQTQNQIIDYEEFLKRRH